MQAYKLVTRRPSNMGSQPGDCRLALGLVYLNNAHIGVTISTNTHQLIYYVNKFASTIKENTVGLLDLYFVNKPDDRDHLAENATFEDSAAICHATQIQYPCFLLNYLFMRANT